MMVFSSTFWLKETSSVLQHWNTTHLSWRISQISSTWKHLASEVKPSAHYVLWGNAFQQAHTFFNQTQITWSAAVNTLSSLFQWLECGYVSWVQPGGDKAGIWPQRSPGSAATSTPAARHHSQPAAALLHPACPTQGVSAQYKEGQFLKSISIWYFCKFILISKTSIMKSMIISQSMQFCGGLRFFFKSFYSGFDFLSISVISQTIFLS